MAINYPVSLDNFQNPVSTDPMNSATVPHATQHANLNDAVEALETKVGIDNSADTDSHDYKLRRLSTPVGMIAYTIATVQPDGWLFHNQTIANANASYPDLWAIVPASWKSGNSLVIPNMGGLTMLEDPGIDNTPIGETNVTGENFTIGEDQLPAHAHSFTAIGTNDQVTVLNANEGYAAQSGPDFVPGTTVVTNTTGSGNPVTTPYPRYLSVNWMIKAS
jgi:microcystin-dependent protein